MPPHDIVGPVRPAAAATEAGPSSIVGPAGAASSGGAHGERGFRGSETCRHSRRTRAFASRRFRHSVLRSCSRQCHPGKIICPLSQLSWMCACISTPSKLHCRLLQWGGEAFMGQPGAVSTPLEFLSREWPPLHWAIAWILFGFELPAPSLRCASSTASNPPWCGCSSSYESFGTIIVSRCHTRNLSGVHGELTGGNGWNFSAASCANRSEHLCSSCEVSSILLRSPFHWAQLLVRTDNIDVLVVLSQYICHCRASFLRVLLWPPRH